MKGWPAIPDAAHRPLATAAEIEHFLSRPHGSVRVGVLHPAVADAIAATSREIQLSAETVAKQRLRHPDIGAADYAAIADMAAHPALAVADGENRAILFCGAERLLYLAVKRTVNGDELYAVSLFRGHGKDVYRIARRGRIVLGSVQAAIGAEGA